MDWIYVDVEAERTSESVTMTLMNASFQCSVLGNMIALALRMVGYIDDIMTNITNMNLNEILEIEKSVANRIHDLKEKIVKEVAETPGVFKPIAKNIVIMKFSDLEHNVWDPEYYIPSAQADHVRKELDSVTTVSSFVRKMEEMIKRRGVITYTYGGLFRLNDKTISILEKYYSKTNNKQGG
jgi:hypothetical protein